MKKTPHRNLESRAEAGVTMVQTAALISLVGSLVAIGVPTFLRTVRRSKVAEVTVELDRLHRAVSAYYAAPHGEGPSPARYCLPTAAGPTPEHPSANAVEVDFAVGASADAAAKPPSSWAALAYQPTGPIRYSYSFVPAFDGCDARASGAIAVLRAEGDLDGDGQLSRFERRVTVDREHNVLPGEVLMMRDRIE